MNQDGISRPYRLKDVKKCFGQLSDAVVLQWYRRGFVAGAMIPRGSRSQFAFSFAEIVHIGVIANMARYGLTNGADNLIIYADDRRLDCDRSSFPLTMPELITATYERYSYDCCFVFDPSLVELSRQSQRNRVLLFEHHATLQSPLYAALSLSYFTSGVGWANRKHVVSVDGDRVTLTHDTSSAVVSIYVPLLAQKAAGVLKLPDPWKRQPSPENAEGIRKAIIKEINKL